MGEFCSEEKGADFSGEAIIQRKFVLVGKVNYVKLQLAFSSEDFRRTSRIMLLVQTENHRTYYLMLGISADGHLLFEEDREGIAVKGKVEINFLNNARHSVYYERHGDNGTLWVDRESVPLLPFTVNAIAGIAADDLGVNEVQIGGINTTDPRFAIYKSYSGCLSSEYISWNLF